MRYSERASGIEDKYIRKMEQPADDEIIKHSYLAEELVVDTINKSLPGFEARLSSAKEDSGSKQELRMKQQIIDAVAYHDGKPALGIHITTAEDPTTQLKKMKEIIASPFIRLDEMKNSDTAIPKVLVYVDRDTAASYENHHEISQNPEVILRVLNGIVKSLKVDMMQTKNPREITAIKELIQILTEEQKKLIH